MADDKPSKAGDKQAVRDTRGRFRPGVSGNPAGRSARTVRYRQALDDLSGDAFKALHELVVAREPQAVLWVCGRMVPALKARSEPVALPGLDGDVAVRARGVIDAATSGKITTDDALALLGGLRLAAEITLLPELLARLDKLESKL